MYIAGGMEGLWVMNADIPCKLIITACEEYVNACRFRGGG